ncbi:MAG: [protein-PII] uridylyltransferase [Desulfobulbaceae bacterium]|nr:[protein-PII] uridylyltransferase [Desulfobulbaceae bacterium]
MPPKLQVQRKVLEDLWQQGLSGHELLERHTSWVDTFIINHFNDSPAVKEGRGEVAVVALGGYGRRELYPFSDIDLLLLHDRKAGRNIKEVAESLLYPLWDSGFEVGHSVRTVKDAISFSLEDFIFQVSLLDARFLIGSNSLFEELRERYRKKIIEKRRNAFVETMDRFRAERRDKFGSHSYLLEPHIKEGKGGMRDIQAMLWVARVVFGLDGLGAMEDAGILTRREREDFENSWNMLARVRNRLHYVGGRKNDQLVFEYQEEIAGAFGFSDSENILAVEHFMREVYGHLRTVAVVSDLFFEHVHDVLGLSGPGADEQVLEKDIVARKGCIHIVRAGAISERPHTLMRVFLLAGRTGLPLHHRTRQMIRSHLSLVDDKFRQSKRIAKVFREILTLSPDPATVLATMLDTGLLSCYIPEYESVESLAQHDLYHIYTVDRHQLQTVAELTVLRREQPQLFEPPVVLDVLYIAALLHDVGKGKDTDHSALGAELMLAIGKRFALSENERRTLSFLVRYHLFLPENALRRDLEDQEFIRQTAEMIGDKGRLTMLYLLTVADSKATGPSAWSSWKETLLNELYLKVTSCLIAACETAKGARAVDEVHRQGVSWLRRRVGELLLDESVTGIDVQALPEDYLLNFTPKDVVQHLRIHRDEFAKLGQQVMIFPRRGSEHDSLLIMTRDRAGLLAKLFGVLALHNIAVLSADIFTWPDSTVVDTLHVRSSYGHHLEEEQWTVLREDFNKVINYRLDIGYKLFQKLRSFDQRGKAVVQQLEKKIVVDNDTSSRFTVLEVYGCDRPGTLYRLAQAITDYGLNIHRAKIATEVEQLINIFYLSGRSGEKIRDPQLAGEMEQTLLQIVSEPLAA